MARNGDRSTGKMDRLFHVLITPEIRFEERKFMFGRVQPNHRAEGEEWIICQSEFVSRKHCEICFRNGAFWIKDLGSLNGTFLNGTKIDSMVDRELRFWDKIGLGVSHTSTEVDVSDPKYFVFQFKPYVPQIIQIIDLAGDENQSSSDPIAMTKEKTLEQKGDQSSQKDSSSSSKSQSGPNIISSSAKSNDKNQNIPPKCFSKPGPASAKRKFEEKIKKEKENANILVNEKPAAPPDMSYAQSKRTFIPPKPRPIVTPTIKESNIIKEEDVKIKPEKPDLMENPKSKSKKKPTPQQPKPPEPGFSGDLKSCSLSSEPKRNHSKASIASSATNMPPAIRRSMDSNSGDISSDGMSDSVVPNNQSNASEPIINKPNNTTTSTSTEKKKKMTRSRSISPSRPNKKAKVETPSDKLPDKSKKELLKSMQKRKAVLVLKQLIKVENSIPTIRKCKFAHLSQSDCKRIYRQWQASEKACKKIHRKSIESIPNSTSSDSSNLFTPITVTDSKIKKQNKKRASKEKSKTLTLEESDSEDAHKQKRSRLQEESPTTSPPPVAKPSSSKATKISEQPKSRHSSSSEFEGYSQPYESLSEHSLSPARDEEILDNNRGQESDERMEDNLSAVSEDPPDSPQDFIDPPAPSNKNASLKDADLTNDFDKLKGQRKLKFLDNPPLPRTNKRGQKSGQNNSLNIANQNIVVERDSCQPSTSNNLTIPERLRELAIKSKVANQMINNDISIPRHKAPVKTKISRTNRNDDLLESLMANQANTGNSSTEKQHSEQVQKLQRAAVPPIQTKSTEDPPFTKPISAPQREIPPLPSPETQKNMPLNKIRTSLIQNNSYKHSETMPPAPKVPKQNEVHQPSSYQNFMEKPGTSLAIKEQTKTNVYDYNHMSTAISKSKAPLSRKGPEKFETVLSDDEAYKAVLKWRPPWLEEQKKSNHPPPVTEKWEVVRTLNEYVDYKTYVKTFFPLILLEIWATITQDYGDKRRLRDPNSSNNQLTEYPIAIEQIRYTNDCPMLSSKWQQHIVLNPEHFKRANFIVLDCYTTTNQLREINSRKDFAIITLGIWLKDEKGVPCIQEVDYFSHIIFSTEKEAPIQNSIIHPKLSELNPTGKYRHSFQVVLHSRENLEKTHIGKIRRISYINPKIRDVRALLHLRISKLHNNILHPEMPSTLFNPAAQVSQHRVVPHVSKLNPTQKNVVVYVTDRVKSNEPELLLLHGPPGTGKTRTIIGMILQLLMTNGSTQDSANPKRILVCTPSNTAIDEIMLRLDEAVKELPIGFNSASKINMVRIGDCENPALKKYCIDSQVKELTDKNSMNASIQKSIDNCKKERHRKEQEKHSLRKSNGSKTRLEALERELKEIQGRIEDYKADLYQSNLQKSDKGVQSHQLRRNVLESGNVICSTLNSCSSSVLTNTFGSRSNLKKPFTCCIVDEASQTTEPETLTPLLLQVDKMILVGDSQQLGATVLSKEAESKAFGQSLFARLNNYYTQVLEEPRAVMMLTQQYRMHPDILSWPNEFFYKGRLNTACVGRSESSPCPLKPFLFLNLSSRETSNREGQISNEEEARVVVEIAKTIQSLFEGGKKQNWSIGVITPYNTQKSVIIKELGREVSSFAKNIEVDTVDSFQGREKDIVIISCVRTDDTGFLKNEKRLNVALTRARHSLLIVGDAECLQRDGMWNSLINNALERKCLRDITREEWTSPGFFRKKLFNHLNAASSELK